MGYNNTSLIYSIQIVLILQNITIWFWFKNGIYNFEEIESFIQEEQIKV